MALVRPVHCLTARAHFVRIRSRGNVASRAETGHASGIGPAVGGRVRGWHDELDSQGKASVAGSRGRGAEWSVRTLSSDGCLICGMK